MTVIKVEKLSKKIKDKEILRDISFEINDGECVALIGPNGAGKTTLIDCLLGDKFMSSGQIAIQGFAPTDPRLKQLISVLPQENAVVQSLKVKELLSFFKTQMCIRDRSNLASHHLPATRTWSASRGLFACPCYRLCDLVPVS